MSEGITLKHDTLTATIATDGAWVETFTQDGRPIFYPKQTFVVDDKPKLRGGCHVCLPNFGPGGDSDQPQHGYGREVTWHITEQSDAAVLLGLDQGSGAFAALKSALRYELSADSLQMELSVTNTGTEPLPISLGFHPYFATEHSDSARINSDDYQLSGLAEARFLDGQHMRLELAQAAYTLESRQLPVWALWSDRLAEYVCLEPTAEGFGFQQGTAKQLSPGATTSGTFTIQVASATTTV